MLNPHAKAAPSVAAARTDEAWASLGLAELDLDVNMHVFSKESCVHPGPWDISQLWIHSIRKSSSMQYPSLNNGHTGIVSGAPLC
jgi:hypothetical protein